MRIFTRLFPAMLFFCLFLFSCSKGDASKSVLATFKGGEITAQEYLELFAARLQKNRRTKADESTLREIVTNTAMSKIATEAALDDKIDQDSVFVAKWRQDTDQVLVNKFYQKEVVDRVVTDSLVARFYARISPQYKMAVIYRACDEFSSEIEIAAQKDTINFIYGELKKGRSFQILAKKYSQDKVTRAKGGDLGFMISDAMQEPALRSAMDNLRVNSFSQPVRGFGGFYILKKGRGLKIDVPPFEQIKDDIQEIVFRSSYWKLKQRVAGLFKQFAAKFHYRQVEKNMRIVSDTFNKNMNLSHLNKNRLYTALQFNKNLVVANYESGEITIGDVLKTAPAAQKSLAGFRAQLMNLAQDRLFALQARLLGYEHDPEVKKHLTQLRKQYLRTYLYQKKVKIPSKELFKTAGNDTLNSLPKNLFKIEEIVRKKFEDELRLTYGFKIINENIPAALALARARKDQFLKHSSVGNLRQK